MLDLVENPEDRVSHDAAQINPKFSYTLKIDVVTQILEQKGFIIQYADKKKTITV